jgi:hypothetical protein
LEIVGFKKNRDFTCPYLQYGALRLSNQTHDWLVCAKRRKGKSVAGSGNTVDAFEWNFDEIQWLVQFNLLGS